MRSAVSCLSVCDLWGDRRGLCLSCDSWCISCWSLGKSLRILAPSPSLPFLGLGVGKYGSGEYFPLNSFSVTVPVGCCMQGWFLHAPLPWIPPNYAWGAQAPIQPLRHQFPSLSIDNEFKLSSLWKVTLMLCLIQTWVCCSRNSALWQNLDYKMLICMCSSQCNEF